MPNSSEDAMFDPDSFPDAVFAWNADGVMTVWNRAAELLFGVDKRSALASAAEEVFSLLGLAFPFEEVLSQLRDAPLWRGCVTRVSKTGSSQILEVIARAEGPVGPARFAAIASARDVTRERRELAELREYRERGRALIDQLPEGVGIVDEKGTVVEWNGSNARIFGLSREQVMGKPFMDIVWQLVPRDRRRPERLDRIEKDMMHALETGELGDFGTIEHSFERKDGASSTLSMSIIPLRTARGSAFGFGIATRDISESKRAQRELAFSDEKLSAVFQSSHDIVAFLNERGEIEHINPAAETILKIPLSELIGANVIGLMHPDDRERMSEELLSVVERRMDSTPAVARFLRGDGEYVILETLGHPVDAQGHATRVVVVSRDATQRIRAEAEKDKLKQALEQAQKMESIGRLAGGIAHDFNNLLTGIISNTSLALLDVDTADPLHPLLYDIATAANSAAGLTRQLLSFSRRQIIEPRVIAPGDLIENMRRMIERIIGEDIELVTDIPKDIGNIKVDSSQIEQILVNLAVNARDAMPDGGVLRVEMANEEHGAFVRSDGQEMSAGRYVSLEVTDSGCGMTAEVLSHLFEPFFTTKPSGQGTGLGLATVYGAVQQNGGSIEVASEVDHGTAFRILFPRVEAPAETRVRPLGEILPTGNETVLLVEDDTVARVVATRILKRLGYQVLSCSNGGEALLIAEDAGTHIDLLLTDVVMPGMSGRELARRLSRIRPGLKTLYTSGYTEDVIIHDGILERGIEFLGKPYTLHSVAQKVRQVLDKT